MPRTPTAQQKQPSKMCVRCGKILPLTDFYSNKDWKSQSFHDAWCQDCVKKYLVNKESVAEYCHENNRRWDEAWWDRLCKKAQYKVATDKAYLAAKENDRVSIFVRTAAQSWPSIMNAVSIYGFIDYPDKSYSEEDVAVDPNARNAEQKVHSEEWGGWFDKEYIQTLDEVYKRYDPNGKLHEDVVQDIYVRQIVKAQVYADHVYNMMCAGKATLKEWETAKNVFNDYMKTANIAPASKKNSETSELSLGEIAEWLEEIGELRPEQFEGVHFEPDDVDKILNDYRHVEEAVGANL